MKCWDEGNEEMDTGHLVHDPVVTRTFPVRMADETNRKRRVLGLDGN